MNKVIKGKDLEFASGEEVPKEETPEVEEKKPESGLGKIWEEGGKVIGDFLVKYFQGLVPGQTGGADWSPKYENAVRYSGIYLFDIEPLAYNNGIHHSVVWSRTIEKKHLVQMLRELVGDDYILETDIVKSIDDDLSNKEYLFSLIPDLEKMQRDLLVTRREITTYHPLVYVMDMKIEYRPMMALAIKVGIDNDDLEITKTESCDKRWKDDIEQIITKSMPSLESLTKFARLYNITALMPMLEDFKRVKREYKTKWGA